MARRAARLPENVPGPFFVDDTCIDCAVCRHLEPAVFGRSPRELSFVARQPDSEEERRRSLMALVACPTSSIGTEPKIDATPGVDAFPDPIADGVFSCGFTAESSFGAWSYLVTRSSGNVLVDSPRAAEPLLKRLGDLGGVRYMFLSHRDDVADHAAFERRFGCQRILHERDVTAGTRGVERKLAGQDPVPLGPDLLAIPVPGHTPGSAVLLYRETFLFTGDHLMGSEDDVRALRLPRGLLVLLARAGAIDGAAAGLPVRVGPARPRRAVPRGIGRGHAEGAGARRDRDEGLVEHFHRVSAGTNASSMDCISRPESRGRAFCEECARSLRVAEAGARRLRGGRR
jgi:glyoxylase-like metal-dependent hydrolase (beta-lactamase superfamily II)/ferredoxin